MDAEFLKIIYITMFFLLSIVLYLVVIPSKQEFIEYKKSRRILGFAFMMIVVMEVLRIHFPPVGLKRFLDLAAIIFFSFTFTSLNFVSFLYMLHAPRPVRQMVKKMSVICGLLIFCLGFTGYLYVDIRKLVKAVMTGIYLIICLYQFTICIREYDKLTMSLREYDAEKLNIKWMYPMLWATAICALLMACTFFYKPFTYLNCVLSLIIYTLLTVRILSFIPANLKSVREQLNNRGNYDIPREMDLLAAPVKDEAENAENPAEASSPAQFVNPDNSKGYLKIEPLIQKWIEEEAFTKDNISIKDAASQMGTNSNYLSQYINKELNTSFANWLNTLRIEKSKEYLGDTSQRMSIEDIGIKVGYPNIYNFSRWFKIVTGMSPSEWRKIQ